jgi:hypothetical protein
MRKRSLPWGGCGRRSAPRPPPAADARQGSHGEECLDPDWPSVQTLGPTLDPAGCARPAQAPSLDLPASRNLVQGLKCPGTPTDKCWTQPLLIFPLTKRGRGEYKNIVLVERFASRSRTAKRRVNRTTPTQGKSSSVADVAGRFSRVIWPFFGK